MHQFNIPIHKTGFCSVLGSAEAPDDLWFVLHGYGQLSEYFIKHFSVLADDRTVIAAPEAPSRFYLDGTYGRVGACWMTKHERETDIADLNLYLDAMFDEIRHRHRVGEHTRLRFLAFSQGVPVLCRWLARRDVPVHQLILWAGAVPHDLPLPDLKRLLERGSAHLAYGTADPYLQESRFPMLQTLLNEQGLPVQIHTFDGGHTLDAELLKNLKNLV